MFMSIRKPSQSNLGSSADSIGAGGSWNYQTVVAAEKETMSDPTPEAEPESKLVPYQPQAVASPSLFGCAESEQSAVNWAWAAGFIDGEGSFFISREKNKRR